MENALLCFKVKKASLDTFQTLRYEHISSSSSRFDYSGIGSSDGNLAECTVGKWRKDVLSILDDVAEGPQVTIFVK